MTQLVNNDGGMPGMAQALEEEIDTLQSMYPDQVTISQSPLKITCVIKDNLYAIQVIFMKSSDDAINISVSNHPRTVNQYSKKQIQKIESKLKRIYQQSADSMPIYNCISYLNDSLDNISSKSEAPTKRKSKSIPKTVKDTSCEQKSAKHNTNHDYHRSKNKKHNTSNNRFRFKHKNMKNMQHIDDGYDYLFAYNCKHYVKDAQATDQFVLFYKDVFSQWFPAQMVIDDVTYTNCEQYMMAEKAKLFGDEEYWNLIMAETDPCKVKKLGRGVRGFKEQKWKKHREQIVYRGNLAKFTQNEILKKKLLNYDHKLYFVEASGVDKIWGIGLSVTDPAARHKRNWKGLNLLGKAITKVRNDIID
eukprot:78527_1